jgi:hypothetical protein
MDTTSVATDTDQTNSTPSCDSNLQLPIFKRPVTKLFLSLLLALFYFSLGWYLFHIENPEGFSSISFYPEGTRARITGYLLDIYFLESGCLSLLIGGVFLPFVAPIIGVISMPWDLTCVYMGIVNPILSIVFWRKETSDKIFFSVLSVLFFRGIYVLVAIVISPFSFLVGSVFFKASPTMEWIIRAYLLGSYLFILLPLFSRSSNGTIYPSPRSKI